MKASFHIIIQITKRALYALLLALCLFILFPAIGNAQSLHAVLLRSDPAKDAVLTQAPSQVRMWFSEDLNPTFSTVAVVSGSNKRVDMRDAHVTSSDPREMDISLQPNLPPATYIVVWRTQSADDGHVLVGTFLFGVATADGSVPRPTSTLSIQNVLGSNTSTDTSSGQLDGPTLLSFIMITLVDLGAIFWVGTQLWRTFVSQSADDENEEQDTIEQREEERFERYFSIPALLIIFLANIGVLIGQGLLITGGNLGQALSPSLLLGLARNGRFGTYWTMREIVLVLAALLALYALAVKPRVRSQAVSRVINGLLPWANLILGLALLIAITLSGHAAATSSNVLVYAVLVDWLHLLAASLWIGGMMYISTIFLPSLRGHSLEKRTGTLLATLGRFSPLAITGVIIMTVSGPFNAVVHMNSLDQLITTAYGRTLVVKVLLVGGLLLTSAIHVGLFRPRLAKDYEKYRNSLETDQDDGTSESAATVRSSKEFKQLEGQVSRQSGRLTTVLRWEPLLGVAVLVCTGLLNVFAGTLTPATTNQQQQATQQQQQQTTQSKPFTTTVQTTDNKYTIKLSVSPNRFGTNVFTVSVLDSQGKPDTNVGVSIYTTMLDMDMGTNALNLQPDGKGSFSGSGDLDMGGNWQLRIQIRTPDNTLHEAKVKLFTPY